MPKRKTKKAVAKRFRRTASGRLKRASTGRGHLLSGKTRKRKRHLRKSSIVSAADHERLSRALPG
jgi:large subunit ribosomal protein L35